MNAFVDIVERIAGYLIGVLAVITCSQAILRYTFNVHIPDGFIIGQTMQGIAIFWGIATATYANRHVTVDVLYEFSGPRPRRVMDLAAYTVNLAFMALFGFAMTYKTFDILATGEISTELRIPIWTGYTLAALGVLAAATTAGIRWWQVVVQRR
ncbi:TRAP transporter small permease [Pseudorhodoplanes sp.]|uniref:TRAP transporter small permease n=1 Tax=Pseudorhodoplanes sp. TaxID=1934341 RepID=UPI003D0D4634